MPLAASTMARALVAIRVRRERTPKIACFQMREGAVVAFDRQHRFVRRDAVAVVERVHPQILPAVDPAAVCGVISGAEPQNRQGFVDAAEHGGAALEDLHANARMVSVGPHDVASAVEIGVGIVAVAHLLNRQVKNCRIQAGADGALHGTHVLIRGMESS